MTSHTDYETTSPFSRKQTAAVTLYCSDPDYKLSHVLNECSVVCAICMCVRCDSHLLVAPSWGVLRVVERSDPGFDSCQFHLPGLDFDIAAT